MSKTNPFFCCNCGEITETNYPYDLRCITVVNGFMICRDCYEKNKDKLKEKYGFLGDKK